MSEWGSPLECVTNKEFTARVTAPQDTAAYHADIATISSNSLRIGGHQNTFCLVCSWNVCLRSGVYSTISKRVALSVVALAMACPLFGAERNM